MNLKNDVKEFNSAVGRRASLFLNRTVTLKQILVFLLLCLSFSVFYCFYRNWDYWQRSVNGDVSTIYSKYRVKIPEKCMDSIDMHRGGATMFNSIFIPAPRMFTLPIDKLVAAPECSGYQLLSGLNGNELAGFRVIYTNENGEKLITRTVEYLKK